MKLLPFLLAAGISALSSASTTTNTTTPSTNLTVALVRTPPANWPTPFWNKNWTSPTTTPSLNATIAKALTLIATASREGASLVVFPELWFPGYPKGIDEAWLASQHAADYVAQSLAVNSTQWQTLLGAARRHGVYLALAYSERAGDAIYMGQALISPSGAPLIVRRKLRPSGIERSFWSDGDAADGFRVVDTATTSQQDFGRWGLLECWEHFHPSMTFPQQAQLEDVHVAAFPYMPSANDPRALSWESLEVNAAAARLYAVNSGAVTLFAAVGYSAVYAADGTEVASVEADVDWDEQPLLFASVNASAFRREAYDVDGEQSWGVLKQIEGAWPASVPKVNGTFVEKKTVSIGELLANIQE
ncbi:Nitrilase [Lasiodiplodia hormozganensis]|uniref:nitrilase n=1 Tax=Lasiodiplodia hormozganensis TaxID=869390 RepID=A0AA39XUI1_9PEZI|nr:Nitrilase [Lasiodiplodia hormozganensis]